MAESPAVTSPQKPTLYVGNLDPSASESDLLRVFSGFGPILSVRVLRDRRSGESLRYAYLNFLNRPHAANALKVMNHKPLMQKPMRIMWSLRSPITRKSGVGNLFVKNLERTIGEAELERVFGKYGAVVSCKVAVDGEGQSRGFGYVQMDREGSAKKAIESLNGKIIKGFSNQKLYVAKFLNKRLRYTLPQGPKFTNLYVKNLGRDFTEESLHKKFTEFGRVRSAVIAKDGLGKSKGFGFVNFERPEEAQRAMDAMNGSILGSLTIYVGPAQKRAERENLLKKHYGEKYQDQRSKIIQESNVYVKFLHDSVDDKALRQHFLQCGKVVSAKVMQLQQGISRGFGFVCFSSPQEAKKAVATLHGTEFRGKRIYVAIAQRKEDRQSRLQAQYISPQTYGQPSPYFPQHYGQPLCYVNVPYQGYQYVPLRHPYQHQWVNTPLFGSPYQSAPFVPKVHPAKAFYPVQATKPFLHQNFFPKRMPKPYICTSGSKKIVELTESSPNAQQEALPAAYSPASAEEHKKVIGDVLLPKVQELEAKHAKKITGKLLEMSGLKLCEILLSPQILANKVEEAAAQLRKEESKEPALPADECAKVEPASVAEGKEISRPSSEESVKAKSATDDEGQEDGPTCAAKAKSASVIDGQVDSPTCRPKEKTASVVEGRRLGSVLSAGPQTREERLLQVMEAINRAMKSRDER